MAWIGSAEADDRSERFPVGAAVTVDQLVDDLHPTLARLRSTEPVSWLPSIGGWLVTGYDQALEVLRDPDRFTVDDERFTTGRVVGPSMLSTDGAEHQRHRQPFEAMFRRAAVATATDAMSETAGRLIDGMRDRGGSELRTTYAAPLAVDVIARFLGFHQHGRSDADQMATNERLLMLYRTIVDTVVGLGTGSAEPADAAAAIAELGSLVDDAVAGGGPLAAVAAAGDLSDEELRANVAVILFGAIETSEGMTANAIGHVLGEAGVLQRLRTGSVEVDRVVNESLRLEPAAAVVDRYATVDTVLDTANGGPTIAAGDLVEVSLAGANRDPRVFPYPDRFDPDRDRIGHHLAFARGPHVCLGLHLARRQTAVGLQVLMRELPDLALDAERSTSPAGHIFRKPERVVVRW